VSTGAPTVGRLLGSWTLDGVTVVALVAPAVLYALGVLRLRGRWPAVRTCSFMAGVLALAVALLSGIDGYAQKLLSVHMVQHLLLMLVAPALLLLGAPLRLLLAASPTRVRHLAGRAGGSRALRVLMSPAVGLLCFAAAVLASHLSGLFVLALRDARVHVLEHCAYFAAGVLLLAPLIGADPLPRRVSAIGRICCLLGAMTVMAIPGALLAFDPGVRYRAYIAPARALGRSALDDQHLAGVIMWIGGSGLMLALALAVAMRAMIAEERRQRRRERYEALRA
jgi:putative membrane protein